MADGITRQPRACVAVSGGILMPLECSVHLSCHQTADTFEAELALDDPSGLDARFWLDTPSIPVTISGTNDIRSMAYVPLLIGNVDVASVSFHHRKVKIRGRDLTALLTDNKTNQKWLNQSDEAIIQQLAGQAGLSVQISGGSDKSGLQFKEDYNRISDQDACWNMIVKIARKMGCIAFVKLNTLYVQPFDQTNGSAYAVYYQAPSQDGPALGTTEHLTCTHNLTLTKTVKVKVQGWRHKQGQAITSEYTLPGGGAGQLSYDMRSANPTKANQDHLTKSRLMEIASHERTASMELPGDVTLDPQGSLVISGTGTGADQSYLIGDIHHRFAFKGGFQSTVAIRNVDSARGSPSQVS